MKRLAKILALVLLAVVIGALWKSNVVSKAVDTPVCSVPGAPARTIKTEGGSCGPNPEQHPDLNVKLRGFEKMDVPVSDLTLKNLCGPTDFDAPKLDTLFTQTKSPKIFALYEVGFWEGKQAGIYKDGPHMAGFEVVPNEQLVVPQSGYSLGCGYAATVLFADDDSITLKYTTEDNVVDGYTIQILGINVNKGLKDLYNATKNGTVDGLGNFHREVVPALKAGEPIGTVEGNQVWVIIRDKGTFMDPRSIKDWWSGGNNCKNEIDPTCCGNSLTSDPSLLSPETPPGYAGSTNASPRSAACDVSGLQKYESYPPLGSLQSCPPEFKTVGQINADAKQFTPPAGSTCGIIPHDEPVYCQHPELIDKDNKRDDWCGELHRLCYPESVAAFKAAGGYDCGGGPLATGNYDRSITGFCLGQRDDGTNNPIYILWQKVYNGIKNNACVPLSDIPPKDQETFGYCLKYLVSRAPASVDQELSEKILGLPACVPTKSNNNRCTSACGDPLSLNETLSFQVAGDCATGECKANIKISDQTPLQLPFAAKLANYFAGTFDAGAVADGYISKNDLVRIRKEVAEGNTKSINEMFAAAGVARKLLPQEIQDQLKCQFINYVKDKVAKFPNEATRENTKYIYKDKDDNIAEFKIQDIPVSQIQLPPFVDPTSCSSLPRDKGETDVWSETPSGQAWVDVPLFDNEESQGKVEFVSGGVFTTDLNPIQTSIPEIKRLNSVTEILQLALSPQQLKPNPEVLKLTIGPEISPGEYLLACRKNTPTLKDLYGDNASYALEPGVSNYNLGVECQQANTKTGDPDSEICTVGPEGQLNCFQQMDPSGLPSNRRANFPDVKVQTRNVTPYLYDTFLQTIEKSGGLLRIFKPNDFEDFYKPYPAESNKIKYELQNEQAVSLGDPKDPAGWKLLFDKLGGVWTAQQFVLKLLQPAGGSNAGTK